MDPVEIFRRIPLFRGVPPEQLERAARLAVVQDFPAGATVLRAGDPGDAFYAIASGRVEVLVEPGGGAPAGPVALLGPGECFGEMALLSGEPRSATIRAVEEARLLALRRADFSSLVSDPAVHQGLIRLLCARLRRTDEQLDAAQRAQLALSHFLSDSRRHLGARLAGSTATARKLAEAVEAAAATDSPLLIAGEAGAGKSLVAATIVRLSRRAGGPMITVDCAAGGNAAPSEIFGHEAGAVEEAEGQQLGALELCAGGTVVVAEPQSMPLVAQDRLVKAIQAGHFSRIGGQEKLPLDARVILTRRLAHEGPVPQLSPALRQVFGGGPLVVPPLRRRRRDIPEIAAQLAQGHARRLGRATPEVAPAAMELLLSHDWPNNVRELDGVIQRAVALAEGGVIGTEHIILQLPSGRREGRVDLLRLPWLSRFVRSRWYPAALQIPALLVFGVVLYACFFGVQDDSNPGLQLTWPIWWAALPFSFLLLGRVWCTICPFPLVSSLAQRLGSLRRKPGAFLRRTDVWLMAGLFIFLTWADEFWHYPDVPRYTGGVLVAVFAGTLLMSLVYERRAWCRYLCPLGGVNGVYASTALVEVRANTDVCGHHCTEHACIRPDSPLACPMLERPLALDENRNCNLCLNCVKACPHEAVHLNLRTPGAEIWEQRKPVLAAGVLSVLLAGTMLTHAFCAFAGRRGLALEKLPPAGWLGLGSEEAAWTLFYPLGMALAVALAVAAARISAAVRGEPWKENLARYGLSFAVLALLMHIALEGIDFLEWGIPTALSLVGERLGGSIYIDDYQLFLPLFLRLAQLATAIAALGFTLYVIGRVARSRPGGAHPSETAPYVLAAGVIGLLFLGLLAAGPR